VIFGTGGRRIVPSGVSKFAELVLGRLHLRADAGDLALDRRDLLLRGLVVAVELGELRLFPLEVRALLLTAAAELLRVLELVLRLLDLALDDADLEVPLELLHLRALEFAFESADLLRVLTARDRRLGLAELLHDLLIGLVRRQSLVLGRDLRAHGVALDREEIRLILLPRTAEDVVVPHRPDRPGEQQPDDDQEDGAVGFLLLVLVRVQGHRPFPSSVTRPLAARAAALPRTAPRR
jgi:hypothetical protein